MTACPSCASLVWGCRIACWIPNTVWLLRERLIQGGAIETLFERCNATLWNAGYPPMSGQIQGATLVAAPR